MMLIFLYLVIITLIITFHASTINDTVDQWILSFLIALVLDCLLVIYVAYLADAIIKRGGIL